MLSVHFWYIAFHISPFLEILNINKITDSMNNKTSSGGVKRHITRGSKRKKKEEEDSKNKKKTDKLSERGWRRRT